VTEQAFKFAQIDLTTIIRVTYPRHLHPPLTAGFLAPLEKWHVSWVAMSLPPLVEPAAALTRAARERAARTISLDGFGDVAQRRLAGARVLVLGAGGLGSPALAYLAAVGVGVIGVVDFDVVDASNLQRQLIHRLADVGESKTRSAARSMRELNSDVLIREYPVRLTRDNASTLFADYDLIIDGTDNFATRYLANDAAALARKPYVWGSVLRWDGQVTVFWEGAPDGRSLDYRDLHPVPPDPGDVLSCAEAGVLGTVCATIGAMMATEAIKLITGTGEALLGRLLVLDALAAEWSEIPLRRHPDRSPVTGLIDYEEFCGLVDVDPRYEVAERMPGVPLIDVREGWEHDRNHLRDDRLVPLATLLGDPTAAGPGPLVVYCETGVRSNRAVLALRGAGIEAWSLRGGIAARP
jgi:sulfur-carrier protein adenylyltransferase/sulfurtransferase